jgi:hypothetical protein
MAAPLLLLEGCDSSSMIRSSRMLLREPKSFVSPDHQINEMGEVSHFRSSRILTFLSPERCSSVLVALCFCPATTESDSAHIDKTDVEGGFEYTSSSSKYLRLSFRYFSAMSTDSFFPCVGDCEGDGTGGGPMTDSWSGGGTIEDFELLDERRRLMVGSRRANGLLAVR